MDQRDRDRILRALAFERSLPDGIVEGTDLDDWQRVLDLVRGRGWPTDWRDGSAPASASELLSDPEWVTLKVWPDPSMQVNLFAYGSTSIDFDFDSREVVAHFDLALSVIREIGRAVGKVVELRYEGADVALLAYDPTTDAFDGRP